MTRTKTPASVPVGSLTDAELAVLTRPRTRVGPRPVMPVWARLTPDQRATRAREARSALVARRLLAPDARARHDVRRDLRSVLVLRESAAAVVAVARVTPSWRDHWYAHLVGDVVLLEQVGDAGVHHFALTAAATLPDLVVAAVLHPRAIDATAPTPDEETDWLRADVELCCPGGPRAMAWVSAPGGTWQLPVGPGGSPVHPVAPADVRRALSAAVVDLLPEEADDGR